MRKLVIIFLLICCFAFPQICLADFTVVTNMENLNTIFEKSKSATSWVDSTPTSRAYLWIATLNDLLKLDNGFDCTNDNKIPVALIGFGQPTRHYMTNDTIYMYMRDTKGLFRQVIIRPSENYMIFEDVGISYEKAKERMLSLAMTCYEMTMEEMFREAEVLGFLSKDQSTTKPQGSDASSTGPDSTKESKTGSDTLPTVKGPYTGKTVKVTVQGKTLTIHQSFKTAMDKYQSYFESYIDMLNSLDKNAPDYMTKYMELMGKYAEVAQALEDLGDVQDLTADESLYCLYIVNNINSKLLAAMND